MLKNKIFKNNACIAISCILYIFMGSIIQNVQAEDDFFETKVQKVLAGDRIMLSGGTIVQYYGIEVPSLTHANKGLANSARLALQENERLVQEKTIRVEFVDVDDTSSVKSAYVFASGVLVNGHLIKNGLAKVRNDYDKKQKYYSYFWGMQYVAKNKKKGVWAL